MGKITSPFPSKDRKRELKHWSMTFEDIIQVESKIFSKLAKSLKKKLSLVELPTKLFGIMETNFRIVHDIRIQPWDT